jgi:hypothetical protein
MYPLIIAGIILFAVQLTLCMKVKRIAVKCVPVYVLIIGIIYCGLEYIGFFGSYSAGAISGNKLGAVLMLGIILFVGIGDVAAWIGYAIIKKIIKKDSLQ